MAESTGAARLEAVYDRIPLRWNASPASTRYRSAARASRSYSNASNAVMLCRRNTTTPQAIAALGAGVHVLSEVPAAVSLPQSEALVGAVRASTATYAMAENYCYTRPNIIVRSMARSGVFGDLYYGEGEYLHDVRDLQQTPSGQRSWRSYWQAGRNGFTYPRNLGPLVQSFDDASVLPSAAWAPATTHRTDADRRHRAPAGSYRRGALLRAGLDMLSNRPHLMDYFSLQGTAGALYEAARAERPAPRVYVRRPSDRGAWESLDYLRAPTSCRPLYATTTSPALGLRRLGRSSTSSSSYPGRPPEGSVPSTSTPH